jgi:hypothetical protein
MLSTRCGRKAPHDREEAGEHHATVLPQKTTGVLHGPYHDPYWVASRSGAPGYAPEDARDLYEAMQTLLPMLRIQHGLRHASDSRPKRSENSVSAGVSLRWIVPGGRPRDTRGESSRIPRSPRVAIPHRRNGRLERVRRAWCQRREEKFAPYRKPRLTTRGSARINAGSHSFRMGRFPTLARSLRVRLGDRGFGVIL